MKTLSIVDTINSKHNELLFEVEEKYSNILTNKINGLVVRVNIKPINTYVDDYFLHKGQDFFKVENIKQAINILEFLGFKDKNIEKTVKLSFYDTFNTFDEALPFFLGIYISEAVIRQSEF